MKFNQRIFKRAVVQILYENELTLVDLCDTAGLEYETAYGLFSLFGFISESECCRILSAVESLISKDYIANNPDWKDMENIKYNLASDVSTYFKGIIKELSSKGELSISKKDYPVLFDLMRRNHNLESSAAHLFNNLADLLDKEIELQLEMKNFMESLSYTQTVIPDNCRKASRRVSVPDKTSATNVSVCVEVDPDIYAEFDRISKIMDVPVDTIINSILKKKLNAN